MQVDKFKTMISTRLEQVETIILRYMPDKGNACYESQKVCVLQGLNEMYALINGIEEEDMKPLKEQQ